MHFAAVNEPPAPLVALNEDPVPLCKCGRFEMGIYFVDLIDQLFDLRGHLVHGGIDLILIFRIRRPVCGHGALPCVLIAEIRIPHRAVVFRGRAIRFVCGIGARTMLIG